MGDYCYDARHDEPCALPCKACEEECVPDLIARAEALGREHGTAAGTWVEIDGPEAARRVIDLDNDCDWPDEWWPSAPLSGEWADGMTPALLLEELGAQDVSEDDYDLDGFNNELCDAYEQAYYDAWRDEVLRMARYQVGES